MQKSADSKVTTASEENFKAIGKLSDRSGLSDEMRGLCAELPIYRIRKINEKQNDADEMEDPIMDANDLVDVVKEGAKSAAKGNKIIKWKSCPCRSYNNTIISFKKMDRSTKR